MTKFGTTEPSYLIAHVKHVAFPDRDEYQHGGVTFLIIYNQLNVEGYKLSWRVEVNV